MASPFRDEQLLTQGLVADILSVSKETVRKWERSGKLLPHKKNSDGTALCLWSSVRRLSVAHEMTNQNQTGRCHPEETRPLTIREYARIQTFPDDWDFCGSVASQYKQIGNAVPVNLAEAIGRSLIALLNAIHKNASGADSVDSSSPTCDSTIFRQPPEKSPTQPMLFEKGKLYRAKVNVAHAETRNEKTK